MKKYIATALFFASFGIAFAQVRGFYGDITWVFYDRPGSSVGLCEVWHFTDGDPRYEATRIPLSIRDAVGQIVRLPAQTLACPS